MNRLALLLTLPLLACGDDTVASETSGGTTAPLTTTGITPTTGGTSTGTTGDEPETTGSGGQTGSTSGSSSSSSTTDTTAGVDASSSTSDGTTDGTTDGTSGSTTGSTTEEGTSSTGEDSSSSSGSSSDTGADTEGMQPLVAGVCMTNDLTTFVEPMAAEHELHIVGVYQPTAGMITVTIERVGIPISLVLSSYEPVAFNLVLAPGVELVEVILNGYEIHSVMGQGNADVVDFSGVGNYLSACAYVWPDDDQGCDTPTLVSEAESLTGLTLSSFVGCYEGAAFTLK